MSEEWRPWPLAPDKYEVSSSGRVRSLTRQRDGGPLIRRAFPDRDGYLRMTMFGRSDPRRGAYFVHRMVLEAFVGPCPDGWNCDHINGKRDDNRLRNLRWIWAAENIARRRLATGARNATSANNPNGHRCEMATATGSACRSRAYARVAVSGRSSFQAWLCGAHQNMLRNQGHRLELLYKWKANDAE